MMAQGVTGGDVLDTTIGQVPSDIVTCKEGGNCTFCDLVKTIQRIVQWVTGIAILISVILLIYAGYEITFSGGDVNVMTKGRTLLGNVAIGIFIVVLAASLIDVLLKTTTGGGFGFWSPISGEKCGQQVVPTGVNNKPIVNNPNNPGVKVSDIIPEKDTQTTATGTQ